MPRATKKTTRKTAKKQVTKRTSARKPAARKTVAKKASTVRKTTKRTPAKRATTKKAAAPKRSTASSRAKVVPTKKAAPKKKAPIQKPFTQSQLFSEIAETLGKKKQEVADVYNELQDIIQRHMKPRAPGEITLPGIAKIKSIQKPARKARPGINPFTGEEIMIKAKPAHKVVKIRPLKKLKEMVG